MANKKQKKQDINAAILDLMPHYRDLSVRDGIQSWDANKWVIGDILPVVEALNNVAVEAETHGIKLAPTETGGGGQHLQPAKYHVEQPFDNQRQIIKASPAIKHQILWRGRQGLGFIPISPEVQESALTITVNNGVRVVRIFDMMNDISNLETGINILKKLQNTHKDLVIEGAISYITEPEGSKRAWSFDDYGQYAVALANRGCNEIAIKDYTGVGGAEIPDLIKTIKKHLRSVGFAEMPINLHSHGEKPEVLSDALNAGADKVDTAYGDLSGGPSHTNIMNLLKLQLKDRGFDPDGKDKDAFETNPIVEKMREVEKVVKERAKGYIGTEDKPKRPKPLPPELVKKYRMAGGALSDLWNSYIKDDAAFAANVRQWEGKRAGKQLPADAPPIPKSKQEWFEFVLEQCPPLWEKAGRFNTVTPGALILCKQAIQVANKRLSGEPVLMTDYTPEYLDVVLGRYGENRGMENGIGDQGFKEAARMFRALQVLNKARKEKQINAQDYGVFLAPIMQKYKVNKLSDLPVAIEANGTLKLDNPNLEGMLREQNITDFTENLKYLPKGIANEMVKAAHIDKSPDPTDGLDVFRKMLAQKCGDKPITDEMATLAATLRNKTPLGPDDSIAVGLFAGKHAAAEAARAPAVATAGRG